MRKNAHSRRGFVELLLLLVIIILILICAGQCSSKKSSSSSVQSQSSVQASRDARRAAITDRLEALRKRRGEVASMNDQQVKARMLVALDKDIAALEKTLREEF